MQKQRTGSMKCHSWNFWLSTKGRKAILSSFSLFIHVNHCFHYELHKIRCEKQTNWLNHCCLYSTNNNKIYAWIENTIAIPLIFKFVNIIICTIGVVCYPVASWVKNVFIILLIFKFINRPVCTTVAVYNVCCYL